MLNDYMDHYLDHAMQQARYERLEDGTYFEATFLDVKGSGPAVRRNRSARASCAKRWRSGFCSTSPITRHCPPWTA